MGCRSLRTCNTKCPPAQTTTTTQGSTGSAATNQARFPFLLHYFVNAWGHEIPQGAALRTVESRAGGTASGGCQSPASPSPTCSFARSACDSISSQQPCGPFSCAFPLQGQIRPGTVSTKPVKDSTNEASRTTDRGRKLPQMEPIQAYCLGIAKYYGLGRPFRYHQ